MTCEPNADMDLYLAGSPTQSVSLDNKWPGRDKLRHRYINMRVYAVDDGLGTGGKVCMLCAVFNDHTGVDDGRPVGEVRTSISVGEGQLLRFRVCDDKHEW
jgi:hypothetical protein